jgi:hypothetical protein
MRNTPLVYTTTAAHGACLTLTHQPGESLPNFLAITTTTDLPWPRWRHYLTIRVGRILASMREYACTPSADTHPHTVTALRAILTLLLAPPPKHTQPLPAPGACLTLVLPHVQPNATDSPLSRPIYPYHSTLNPDRLQTWVTSASLPRMTHPY